MNETPVASAGHDFPLAESELLGGEMDFPDDTRPPVTANFVTTRAAYLLKGLTSGKITYQAAMGGARLVDAISKIHANKLRAATYQSKPLHKDLLKELSVKV